MSNHRLQEESLPVKMAKQTASTVYEVNIHRLIQTWGLAQTTNRKLSKHASSYKPRQLLTTHHHYFAN